MCLTRTRSGILNFLLVYRLNSRNLHLEPNLLHLILWLFQFKIFTLHPHMSLIKSIIHAYDKFWSSKLHLPNLYPFSITNEDIFYISSIKFVMIDMLKLQSSKNLKIIVFYKFPTTNFYSCIGTYFFLLKYVDQNKLR